MNTYTRINTLFNYFFLSSPFCVSEFFSNSFSLSLSFRALSIPLGRDASGMTITPSRNPCRRRSRRSTVGYMATARSVARPTEFRIMAALLLSVDLGKRSRFVLRNSLTRRRRGSSMHVDAHRRREGRWRRRCSSRSISVGKPALCTTEGREMCDDGKQQPRLATRWGTVTT